MPFGGTGDALCGMANSGVAHDAHAKHIAAADMDRPEQNEMMECFVKDTPQGKEPCVCKANVASERPPIPPRPLGQQR